MTVCPFLTLQRQIWHANHRGRIARMGLVSAEFQQVAPSVPVSDAFGELANIHRQT
jgi:hypothetical protein